MVGRVLPLHNAYHHAFSFRTHHDLVFGKLEVTLTVQDNGAGFDINADSGNKRFGLLGMKERVKFINGDLHIISQPGTGTTVQLSI